MYDIVQCHNFIDRAWIMLLINLHKGLISEFDKMSDCMISQSLISTRSGVEMLVLLWNLVGVLAAPQLCCQDTCQISEWLENSTPTTVVRSYSNMSCVIHVLNRMAWQWAETLVEIRGTLADIRGTTKLGCRWNFPKHEFNRPVCLEAHHYLLAHLSQ